MAAEGNDDEPKLTVKLRSEITEPEPLEYTVLTPAKPIVEPEDEEVRFEETMESVDIPKPQEWKPQRAKAITPKARKIPKNEPKDQPISKLHNELRKHSDARKKTDLAILDIRKELKDLLLIHHATIKDLQKQVTQMHRKIATIERSKKSTRSKTTGKKTVSRKKTSDSKKTKKSISGQNKRKR